MVVLVRIDDRLIHGQVVGGWLPVVQAERIVVASDKAAGDSLQMGLMRMAVPDEVEVEVASVVDVLARIKAGAWGKERVMLLLPGMAELSVLVDGGAAFAEVNIGGLHDAPGRTMVAPHLAFTSEEKALVGRLVRRGIQFETRPLPGDDPVLIQNYISFR